MLIDGNHAERMHSLLYIYISDRYALFPFVDKQNADLLSSHTWFEANYFCMKRGGYIVSPDHTCSNNLTQEHNLSRLWSAARSWALTINGFICLCLQTILHKFECMILAKIYLLGV